MSEPFDRLRHALSAEYELLREVASGGMGIVYAARHRRLDRIDAIKVLKPELATAIAVERFLAEGRLLARLSHPAIVRVHDAGEADGLLYFAMEFVEGETLQTRLERGPLSSQELGLVARDLLSALSVAHVHGVIHRDVKPANIFLRDGHALLADFGVARWLENSEEGELTQPGQRVGTPRYMAPEQRVGNPATTRSDIYSAAAVIYEAATGRHWVDTGSTAGADWTGVPPRFVAPLQRALEVDPDARWRDATALLRSLDKGSRFFSPVRAVVVPAAVVLAAVILKAIINGGSGTPANGTLTIVVPRFSAPGAQALGDSMAAAVRARLSGHFDFRVPSPPPRRQPAGAVVVSGEIVRRGDAILLRASFRSEGELVEYETEEVPRNDWRRLADTLSVELVKHIWFGESVSRWLPRSALPVTVRGQTLWMRAEQFYSEARWEEASDAYRDAEQQDTSCLLCSYRLNYIDRWLSQPPEVARVQRVLARAPRFPQHFQDLIRAESAPLPGRLDSLTATAATWSQFYLAQFMKGEEIFHRGGLYGRLRSDAIEPFRLSVQFAPRFAPGWEHLAWLLIGEGQERDASHALDTLALHPARSGFSLALRFFLQLGFHWRFVEPDSALRFTRAVLSDPMVRQDARAAHSGRLIMSMNAPRGAVALGRLLARWDSPEARRSGYLAQLYGHAAMGRIDSLREVGRRLRSATTDRALPLLALETEAVLFALDPERAPGSDGDLLSRLESHLAEGKEAPELRARAAWAMGLVAARIGDHAAVTRALQRLAADEPTAVLPRILEAVVRRALGTPAEALALLPHLPNIEREQPFADPLADAVVHLLRGRWLAEGGQRAAARATLRWHEHLQLRGYAQDDPQPGEMAWALGTLARWQRIKLLSDDGDDPEICALYRNVAESWQHGTPDYAIRADTARARSLSPACARTLE